MAEIHVEPRRRSKAWLWVLLLVLVLVVAGWILFGAGTVHIGALDRAAESVMVAMRAALPAGGVYG